MDRDIVGMSTRERERGAVIRRVVAGEMTQARAAERLGIGVRQVKRLVAAFRARGDGGLVSGRRGKPSNNRLPAETISRVECALRERYVDFGPTLAVEKLAEHEKIAVSAETVRLIQIRLGLWRPKQRRERRVFQLRERRPRFGELVQIDGSHHAWLEDRGPRLALIVFIDDATGRLTAMRFAATETAHAYRLALRDHVVAHGLPLALYSDRHGIFRVNAKDAESGDGLTAFNRITQRLGIVQICATTPQAKGRVERANKTLQDRLIKEMRLAGISDVAAAQAFLAGFMERHNAKFAVPPRLEEDAHRPWTKGSRALDEQLAIWEGRTLSKALTFSAAGARHCIRTSGAGIAMRGAKVVVRHFLDGSMDVVWKDRILPHTTFRRLPGATAVEDDKTLDARVDAIVADAPKAARGTQTNPQARASGRPRL